MQRILSSQPGVCSTSYAPAVSTRTLVAAVVPRMQRLGAFARLQPQLWPRHVAHAVYQADDVDEEESEEERVAKVLQAATRRIKQLGATGRVRDAIKELANLAQLGIQPDTQAATALVQACTRDMALAQSIFDELFGDLLQPDEVTFAVLLRGYGNRNPPDWPAIDATLTAMRTKHDIAPTATSFNVLLEICCRNNDLERGQDVIDRMAQDGVEPDEFTEEVVARRRALRSYLKKVLL